MKDEDFVANVREAWRAPPPSRDFDARLRARLERRPRWPLWLAAPALLALVLWLALRPTPEPPAAIAASPATEDAVYALLDPDAILADDEDDDLPGEYLALAVLLETEEP